MERPELVTLLERLRQELASGALADPEVRAAVEALDRDIHQALTHPATEPGALTTTADVDVDALTERTQELQARFAVDHPVAAHVLRDILDRLGKMGI